MKTVFGFLGKGKRIRTTVTFLLWIADLFSAKYLSPKFIFTRVRLPAY